MALFSPAIVVMSLLWWLEYGDVRWGSSLVMDGDRG